MSRVELIKQAIESAKCRIYKLNFDTNKELSAHHQKKAENQKELMEITVEALEKQMPKKIVYHDNCGNKTVSERCPRCFEVANTDYCEHCGQALDWSEEDD